MVKQNSQKLLVLIVGVAGSGKTAIGKELSRIIDKGVFLSKDMIKDPFTSTIV